MGNRLGIGTTKALVEVDGKPLIIRHLELLKKEKDIRIVVGYQAEKVIEIVKAYRKDVLFVFNHDYRNNGTGASLTLASRYANEYILSLDGDLLVHPEDMELILNRKDEFICGTTPGTDDPWLLKCFMDLGIEKVNAFSHIKGKYEWTGVVQIKGCRLQPGWGHVYQLLEPLLPIELMKIRTKEIDTINDYENAIEWVRNNYV